MMTRRLIAFALSTLLWGCSAIVSPDEGLLGGEADGATDSAVGDAFDGGPDDSGDGGDDGGDSGVLCPGGCDDGVSCTVDECVGGACSSVPNDDACPPGQVCDPVLGCATASCASDADCDDDAYCNGEESCEPSAPGADARGCIAGAAIECGDDAACTVDTCDEATDSCVNTRDDGLCDDAIGCSVDRCRPDSGRADALGCIHNENDGRCMSSDFCVTDQECVIAAGGCVGGVPRDCSDGDICTMDSCDSAAGMCVNVGLDADGDGYEAVSVGGAFCATGTDCDDDDPAVHPGATELCNGRDDDCDRLIDDSCVPIPDTCASAEPIRVAVGGAPTTVTGRLGDFGSNYNTVCGGAGGRDAVYYVDVTSGVDLTIDTIGSVADTVVSVSTTCSATGFNRLGCDNDIDVGVNRASRVWVHRFGPGAGTPSARLYILVDGANSAATGAFTLNISAVAATADTCTAPIDVTGGGALVGFIAPTTIGLLGPVGTCQGPGDTTLTEAVAQLTATGATPSLRTFSNFFDPDVYIRDSPCATGTELACVAGDGFGAAGFRYETGMNPSLVTGSTYYFFIDGVSTGSAYFLSYQP